MNGDGIVELLHGRVAVIDGAFATVMMSRGIKAGHGYEELVMSQPDAVRGLHSEYIAAGADIITADSMLSDASSLARYGSRHESARIAARAAELAAEAVAASGRRCFVAGSVCPLPGADHTGQIGSLVEAGADVILLESACDTAATVDAIRAIRRRCSWIPIIASATATHLPDAGTFYGALPAGELLAIGYNCSDGPESVAEQSRWLSENAACATILYPNTGCGRSLSPEEFARKMEVYLARGECNIAGGCCGTTPEHTAALSAAARKYTPRAFGEVKRGRQ